MTTTSIEDRLFDDLDHPDAWTAGDWAFTVLPRYSFDGCYTWKSIVFYGFGPHPSLEGAYILYVDAPTPPSYKEPS